MGNTYTHIIAEQEYRKQLLRHRIRSTVTGTHPFEVWAAKYFFIDDFHTLKLNNAQRSLLNELELKRYLDGKVRILVPHAKNLGITTFCEAYFYWLQNIDGQPGDAALIYPRATQYRQSQKRFLSIARAFNNPLNISHVKRVSRAAISFGKSGTINSWHSIRTANAARNLSPRYTLIASADGSSVSEMTDEIAMGFRREPLYAAYLATDSSAHPRSILIIEGNTAECHQDSFWRTALESPAARNFSLKFIPWHESEQNYIKLDTSVKTFYNSLDEYEYTVLWSQLKLTLEQINWYRHNARKVARSVLHAQYPSTLAEALQLDGEFLPITQPVAQIGGITQQPRHKQAGMHTRCETEHTPNILITSLLAKTYTRPGVAFYANPIATPSFVLESDSCGNFSDGTEKFIGSAASAPKMATSCFAHTNHSKNECQRWLTATASAQDFAPDSSSDLNLDLGLILDSNWASDLDSKLALNWVSDLASKLASKNNFPNHHVSTTPAETPLPHVTTNVQNFLYFPNKSNGYFTDNLNFNPNHKYSDFASAPPLTKGRPVIMASLSPPQDPA